MVLLIASALRLMCLFPLFAPERGVQMELGVEEEEQQGEDEEEG